MPPVGGELDAGAKKTCLVEPTSNLAERHVAPQAERP
eukprot:CAMPEP_0172595592 /NCGR_PEP_ID=MMETSP1068-20121228/15200_1 /TAXON_ID=35684 /ORGANISM="Pseudopedinella elastica, Strain CCMP716" /LENGTH=36 /DNA_ID= /DNA_START= /DNA_END= /DNA_ORIENTATION=